ncbi:MULTISPECIES: hypothetical protein [Candidatus Nitrosocaldus]|jgi:hypothetical protein|uniref:Uncharacterized protein n=1 Tax=Candidatus Nitrosocaldus cavascurensis TaxID=2058097 RepID=A0A2K5ARC6_9ARCH|nr:MULTISPECIES: hypothetical protein [Candidatus Nitrosocaldus]SPC34203.1 protein of unknown function [Candidatus Nitrosocaldus cavascurensis]
MSIQELWEKRQLLYRLYDIQGITAWKAKDLLVLYELFEEYNLLDILDTSNNNSNNNNNNTIVDTLLKIKDRLNEEIRVASKEKDFKAKAVLTKKLDKVLTLIALVESKNREGLMRIISMYRLLNRYEELRNALKDIANASNSNSNSEDSIEAITDRIREELEREIIELKKRLNKE